MIRKCSSVNRAKTADIVVRGYVAVTKDINCLNRGTSSNVNHAIGARRKLIRCVERLRSRTGGCKIKIILELPDSVKAAFINYICDKDNEMHLVSKGIGTKDIESGYKDCREYEVTIE